MTKKKLVGYHGTSLENAQLILKEQHFKDSIKDNEWLGKGVYFFQYLHHAQWWISHSRFAGKKQSILQAVLLYADEQLLDLDDPVELERLFSVLKYMIEKRKDSSTSRKLNEDLTLNQRRCLACNLICQIRPEIGMIIYTFPSDSGNNIFTDVTGFFRNQRQICVKDHSIITKVEEAK